MGSLLIKNAVIINEGVQSKSDILVEGSTIKKIFQVPATVNANRIIDAKNMVLLPGIIDDQVHFREPGLTHKGDIFSESRAAAAGGVTSYMEMPNTIPQAVTQAELEKKYALAAQQSMVNYSFYLGATNDNIDEIKKTNPANVCGIKVFMGASTGNMLVDNIQSLQRIFAESPTLVATHCEDEETIKKNTLYYKEKFGELIPFNYHPLIRSDEACYKSSAMAVDLASKYGTRLHILHLSTARELVLFAADSDIKNKKITSEVCVHHLWFNSNDYEKLGSLIKWNPAIKTIHDQASLLDGLLKNKIDVVATDHAPHTTEEKNNTYFKVPSGGPLVQHSLVAMLELVRQKKIDIETVVKKMCHAPADLFRIRKRGYIREGYFADLVLVDMNAPWVVSKNNLLYKCNWSPFEGRTFNSKVIFTIVNGKVVCENGTLFENAGKRLEFDA